METKTYTCTVCPEGCAVTLREVNGTPEVSGNKCRRGEEYVLSEDRDPRRNISSTVSVVGGERPLVPVKTSAPIPKKSIFAVMELIRAASVSAPVTAGQILIKNAAGTGSDIVATADAKAKG